MSLTACCFGKRPSSVGGFAHEIINLRAERIAAVVIPPNVDAATRRGRGPCEKVMLLVVEGVVVDANDAGGAARAGVDRGKVHARRRLQFTLADLIRRESTICRGAVNGASGVLRSRVAEHPFKFRSPLYTKLTVGSRATTQLLPTSVDSHMLTERGL